MNRKPRAVLVASAAAILALAISACSGGGGSSSASSAPDDSPYVIATDSVSGTLEPGSYDGLAHRYAFDMIKGPLVRYKNTDEVEGGIVATPGDMEPWLAESWEIQPDGIEFTLRDDVVSPYGNPLTPEDVVYTIDRIYAAESALGKVMLNIAGVNPDHPAEVTGENTVKVFAAVNYTSLFAFETYWLAPLDSVEVEKHVTADDPYAKEWLATHSAMFGAYYVGDDAGSFTPTEEIRLAVNPNYTRERVNFSDVVMQAVPEAAGRISLLQSGQASQIINVSYENLKALQGDSSITIRLTSSGSQDTVALNNEVFSDPKVRQAMSYAIDREALARGVYQGFVDPSTSILSTAIPAANSTADSFQYDPEKAKSLLEEAGAVGTQITIYANQTEMTASPDALLPQLEQMLDAAGFDASTQVVASAADYRAAYAAGQYGAWIRQEGPLAADAVYFYNLFYLNGGSSDFGKVNLPEINDGIAAAKPLTGEDRMAAMADAILASNEQQVSLPLVESVSGTAYSAGICPGPDNKSFPLYPATASHC